MRENSGQRWTYMDTFSIYANRTSVLEQEVQIALLALSPHILRSEHRVQTRHSDRKSSLIATLLYLDTKHFAERTGWLSVCVSRCMGAASGWTVRTCQSDRTRRPDAPAFPAGTGQDIFY